MDPAGAHEERGDAAVEERPVVAGRPHEEGTHGHLPRPCGRDARRDRGVALGAAEVERGDPALERALPDRVEVQHRDEPTRKRRVGREVSRSDEALLLPRERAERDGAPRPPAAALQRLGERDDHADARRVVVGPVVDAAGRIDAQVVHVRADEHDLAAHRGVGPEEPGQRVAPPRPAQEPPLRLERRRDARRERAPGVARVARAL